MNTDENEALREAGQTQELDVELYKNLGPPREGPETYRFVLNKDGMPVKLGDGSFSIVFRVKDIAGKPYALKVLYGDLGEDAASRFTQEAQAYKRMREKGKREEMGHLQHVVNPIASTTELHDQPGYKTLKKRFDEINVNLSCFAHVTREYSGTLQDLLSERKDGKTGYDIIKTYPFPDRIRSALPFLKDIAHGLMELHSGECVHLDLKPANVFYLKGTSIQTKFETLIGDLGFIGQPEMMRTGSVKEVIAPGTRHFRSPEQKDYFDVCEAKVASVVDANGETKPYRYDLFISDAKFRDTLIEKGDVVRFFKEAEEHEYKIIEFDRWKEFGRRIQIVSAKKLSPDDRTQIKLYKRQALRTDLFGFGAIAYDMITGGLSPERFYDLLAAEDRENSSVLQLLNEYDLVKAFSPRNPRYLNIFESFLFQGLDYADKRIVSVILKCMLYRVKDNYYSAAMKRQKEEKQPAGFYAFEEIIEELNQLEKDSHVGALADVQGHNLFFTKEPYSEKLRAPDNFSQRIEEIQNVTWQTESNRAELLGRRLCLGAGLFQDLCRLVSAEASDSFFFAPLRPENLELRSSVGAALGFIQKVYTSPRNGELNEERATDGSQKVASYEKYKKDMKNDELNTKIAYLEGQMFHPKESLGFLRRRVYVEKAEVDESQRDRAPGKSGKEGCWLRYRFQDVSPLGDDVERGDWLVVPKSCLAMIQAVREGAVFLVESSIENVLKAGQGNVVYYRKFDPETYYLSMLCEYLHQLFFVGVGNVTVSEPFSVASVRAQLRANNEQMPGFQEKVRKVLNNEGGSGSIRNIYHRLAALYLLSALPAGLNEFFGEERASSDSERNRFEWSGAFEGFRKSWNNIMYEIADQVLGKDERDQLMSLVEAQGRLTRPLKGPVVRNSPDFKEEDCNLTKCVQDILLGRKERKWISQQIAENWLPMNRLKNALTDWTSKASSI